MKDKKGFIILIISICIILLFLLVMGIIFFNKKPDNVIKKKLNGGDITISYSSPTFEFTQNKLVATSDVNGMSLNQKEMYYDFTISTSLDEASSIDYEIAIAPDSNSVLNAKNIKVYLEKQKDGTFSAVSGPDFITVSDQKSKLGSPSKSMVIYKASKNKSSSDNYRLRLWLSDQAVPQMLNMDTFNVQLLVNGKAN